MRFAALLTLVLVLSTVDGWSQDLPVVLRDDFNNVQYAWPRGTWDNGKAEVAGGFYRIDRRARSGNWYLQGPSTFINWNDNYDIEIRARWIKGNETHGFGIAWAGDDVNHTNAMIISANGQYKIYRYVARRYEELNPWQPTSAIVKGSSFNVVTLKFRGSALNIVINGTTVSSVEAPKVLGRKVGLVVWQNQNIEVDYFEIRQVQPPIRVAEDHPRNTARENLGPKVNCDGGDLSPVITADGSQLYIGRYPFAGNIGRPEKEDIYVSALQPDGTWGEMQNVGRPLNNEGSNYLISITPDGNTVLVGNTYRADGRPRGGGVSIAYRTEDGWTIPTEVKVDNYYNRHRFSEMCLDPSGTRLVMAVQRDDSEGEKDLYVCMKRPDGSFSEPKNMRSVNSWGNEMSPFVAADGQTMYFATDGRKGYGGTDIWMTRRLDDTWLNWSEPENLGPVINTSGWDAYYTVPARGDFAYLSATSAENGSADIHRVRLTAGVKPKPVVLVKGRVLDANTKKPLAAMIDYESLTKNKKVGEARSAPLDGAYAIALPAGDLYGFNATAANYYPISDQLDTRDLNEYQEIRRDLYLVPLVKDEVIRLNNLFFDSGESTLRSESFPELDRLAAFLGARATIVIELSGHTDNVGSNSANLKLSKDRVESVKKYLESKGVDAKRMKTKGYGEKKPLAPNSTEEGRQKNRRVEFKIVSM